MQKALPNVLEEYPGILMNKVLACGAYQANSLTPSSPGDFMLGSIVVQVGQSGNEIGCQSCSILAPVIADHFQVGHQVEATVDREVNSPEKEGGCS